MNIDIKKSILAFATAAATWAVVTDILNYIFLFLGSLLVPYLEDKVVSFTILNVLSEAISMFVTAYLTGLVFVKVYSRSNRK